MTTKAQQEKAEQEAKDKTLAEAAPVSPPADKSTGAAQDSANLDGGDVNAIAIGVGIQSRTGERTGGLVGEGGEPINLDTAFDYGDGTSTLVIVTERIYETFTLPGSKRPLTRLVYGAGVSISRETAEGLKKANADATA